MSARLLLTFLLFTAMTSCAQAAVVDLSVTDETGSPLAFRAEIWRDTGRVERFWSDDGTLRLTTTPGPAVLLVRHGIDFDAVEMPVDIPAGTLSRKITLRRRFDARAMGWWSGENHMHVLHGRKDPPATFTDGARIAAADGLDYIQLADAWEPTFSWLSAEQLNRMSAAATTSRVVVGWNIEGPKCYMSEDDGGEKGNLHCFGHGWTMALKDISRGWAFFHTGPNYPIIQEIRRQGAVVVCGHPVRFWFNKGNFVSNMASELPFDFVAGAAYDAIDILNDSPKLFLDSERLWWNLLNMGYKVAGTGNSDGNLGGGRGVGRYRTYLRIDGPFTWEKGAQAIRDGACIATSGPFVQFDVDGRTCGAEFPADGAARQARIRAWSSPLPGETLLAVQIVRNGEIVHAWDLRRQRLREWSGSLELSDTEYAWYVVRVLSTCADRVSLRMWGPHVYELAVAGPVYFLPAGFQRPRPTPATVTLIVRDQEGRPLPAAVKVLDAGSEIAAAQIGADGHTVLEVPATAMLVISSPGYADMRRSLYMDTEIFDYCRNVGGCYPSFYTPETFRNLAAMLGRLKLVVTMTRQ